METALCGRRRRSVSSLAALMLGTEPNGLALSGLDSSIAVRDTVTPANAYAGDANGKLVYASPSTKWILGANGRYQSGTTLRTEYAAFGNALGWRLEEARTNLHTQSASLSSLTSASNATVTDNVGADIFGGTTAGLYQRTGTQSYRGFTFAKAASALPYCFSCVVQRSVGDYVCLTVQGSSSSNRLRVTFNLATGLIAVAAISLGAFTTPAAGIEPLPGGRYRIWLSGVSDSSTLLGYYISFASSAITAVDSADTASVAAGFVSQIQLEQAYRPSSPIVTVGSTVTRAADIVTLATSLFPSAFPLTIAVVGRVGAILPSIWSGIVGLHNGSIGVHVGYNPSGQGKAEVGATPSADLSANGTFTGGSRVRMAAAFAENDVAISLNGAAVTTDTDVAMPVGVNKLQFNSNYQGVLGPAGMHLESLLILPGRSANAELQGLLA